MELHLRGGRALSLRSVVEATAGWVTLEVFLARDEGSRPPRWQEELPASGGGGRAQPTYRASVAYEAIAAVILSDAQATAGSRVGFAT